MTELTLRLVFSLAIVLGLLMLCARFAGRRFQGRRDAVVQVVHRQPIGRHASVSVVNVSGRILVLGTTDQEVRLLTELDPDDLADDSELEELEEPADLVPLAGDPLLTLLPGGDAVDFRGTAGRASTASIARALEALDSVRISSLHSAPAPTSVEMPTATLPAGEPAPRPGRHSAAKPGARRAAPRRATARRGARVQPAASAEHNGALAGSLLSARTWRQAWGAVSGQAS
jgi:flagellar protein FliO/FliZ